MLRWIIFTLYFKFIFKKYICEEWIDMKVVKLVIIKLHVNNIIIKLIYETNEESSWRIDTVLHVGVNKDVWLMPEIIFKS